MNLIYCVLDTNLSRTALKPTVHETQPEMCLVNDRREAGVRSKLDLS